MFRPNWPSLTVQVVMVKDSAAYCNAMFHFARGPKIMRLTYGKV
jgi:hypothetical protein